MEKIPRISANDQPCLPHGEYVCPPNCPLHSDEVRRQMRSEFHQLNEAGHSHGAVEKVEEILAANNAFRESAEVMALCLLHKDLANE